MLPYKIEKPWGFEELLEKNDFYVVKKLFMKKSNMCSLQYHKEKHETIYVLSGKLKVLYGKRKSNLKEIVLIKGQTIVIPPKVIHRMIGESNVFYLEASTPQLDDVVRLKDIYGRK